MLRTEGRTEETNSVGIIGTTSLFFRTYTLTMKGLALDRLGKTNEAIEFYNKALIIDPRNYVVLSVKK
jgi:tetratricopeptide (TPR) repeat protein